MATEYGINDIETLSFKDGVRKRIAMYLGSADIQLMSSIWVLEKK